MTKEILVRMWKVMARDLNVNESNKEILTMALEGRSTTNIAKAMNLSVTTVQTRIKKCFAVVDTLAVKADLMEKLNDLQRQNKLMEQANNILKENMNNLLKNGLPSDHHVMASARTQEILLTEISDTPLKPRIKNALYKNGIKTVLDLCRKSRKELISANNLGVKSIDEIQLFLDNHHLKPGMSLIVNPETSEIMIEN